MSALSSTREGGWLFQIVGPTVNAGCKCTLQKQKMIDALKPVIGIFKFLQNSSAFSAMPLVSYELAI